MKNTIELWAKILAMMAFVSLVIQWSWNMTMSIFGLPEINILHALGLFVLVYLVTTIISIAWHAHTPPANQFIVQGQNQNNTDGIQE